MVDRLPQKTEKPWGYELLWAHTQKYAGKIIFVRKGHRLSLQYHKRKDENIYVYQGKALIEVEGGDGRLLKQVAEPGYCIHVAPLTKHRLMALEDTTFLEVSTPELDDIERVADDYGRV